jgi:hypothetical protein
MLGGNSLVRKRLFIPIQYFSDTAAHSIDEHITVGAIGAAPPRQKVLLKKTNGATHASTGSAVAVSKRRKGD